MSPVTRPHTPACPRWRPSHLHESAALLIPLQRQPKLGLRPRRRCAQLLQAPPPLLRPAAAPRPRPLLLVLPQLLQAAGEQGLLLLEQVVQSLLRLHHRRCRLHQGRRQVLPRCSRRGPQAWRSARDSVHQASSLQPARAAGPGRAAPTSELQQRRQPRGRLRFHIVAAPSAQRRERQRPLGMQRQQRGSRCVVAWVGGQQLAAAGGRLQSIFGSHGARLLLGLLPCRPLLALVRRRRLPEQQQGQHAGGVDVQGRMPPQLPSCRERTCGGNMSKSRGQQVGPSHSRVQKSNQKAASSSSSPLASPPPSCSCASRRATSAASGRCSSAFCASKATEGEARQQPFQHKHKFTINWSAPAGRKCRQHACATRPPTWQHSTASWCSSFTTRPPRASTCALCCQGCQAGGRTGPPRRRLLGLVGGSRGAGICAAASCIACSAWEAKVR